MSAERTARLIIAGLEWEIEQLQREAVELMRLIESKETLLHDLTNKRPESASRGAYRAVHGPLSHGQDTTGGGRRASHV